MFPRENSQNAAQYTAPPDARDKREPRAPSWNTVWRPPRTRSNPMILIVAHALAPFTIWQQHKPILLA